MGQQVDLRVDLKSHVPVHVQLEEQIKHLILMGGFKDGDRLPSIRAMAGFLRVNRNTVARVFSDLEREGYVESRRGSGVYVVEPPVEAEDLRRQEVLERVMDLAAAQGVPVEDLAYALLARAGAKPQEKTPILFVECTRAGVDQVYIDEKPEEVLATLGRVKSVVCASVTARRLRELGIPEDLEIIEEDRILDQGGIEMLRRMLRQLL